MVQHEAPWSEYYNSTPSLLNGLDGSLLPWTRKVFKTNQRACTTLACLNWRDVKHQERNITTPPPSPPRLEGSPLTLMEEVLKTSQRVCTVREYLDWRCMKHQGVSELTPSPLPHGMGCQNGMLALGKLCQHNFGHNSIVGVSSNAGTIAMMMEQISWAIIRTSLIQSLT